MIKTIRVKITTRAADEQITPSEGFEYDFKLKTTTAAVKGRANSRVIALIADYFSVAPSRVKIRSGLRSNYKHIEIEE